jgi:hypothetical protein
MCNLLHYLPNAKRVRCFKVVGARDGGFYSLAMGFKYPAAGHIPVVTEQKRISEAYCNNILTDFSEHHRNRVYDLLLYSRLMVGRTAGYLNRDDAMRDAHSHLGRTLPGFDVAVVEIILSESLMYGEYSNCPVVAGKHMEFKVKHTIFNTIEGG